MTCPAPLWGRARPPRRPTHLRSDQHDRPVEQVRPAVVEDATVHDGEANVEEQIRGRVRREQVRDEVPRVVDRVRLEEVVLAPVAARGELGEQQVGRAGGLGEGRGLENAREVSLEVESPLREVCGGDLTEDGRHVVEREKYKEEGAEWGGGGVGARVPRDRMRSVGKGSSSKPQDPHCRPSPSRRPPTSSPSSRPQRPPPRRRRPCACPRRPGRAPRACRWG